MALRPLLLLALLFSRPTLAAEMATAQEAALTNYPQRPVATIIIDDLGENLEAGRALIALQAPLTFAIIPHTTYGSLIANEAYAARKEVMLHQPMEAIAHSRLGRGGITLGMDLRQMEQILRENLAAVPHAIGINNHMGSLLTQDQGAMNGVMRILKAQGDYYFIDSRTSGNSVALKVAREQGIPSLRRHVFLDHVANRKEIEQQFQRMVRIALRFGAVVAIGHPYPETIATLQQQLPLLRHFGIEVIPASRMLIHEFQREPNREPKRESEIKLWQASLSPLHQDLKSSKQ
ncbi:MAG: divergent polysaccharide deacetylase family protein [Gammaproteobacteria bacterium]|nr:divergent polysaccharide deacetylase family protein [Gammaproteobacteria bacterium]